MADSIKIVPYEAKYRDQVMEMHKKLIPSYMQVHKMQWIGMFLKSNGIIHSLLYVTGLVYAFRWIFSLLFMEIDLIVSSLILILIFLFILFPYLSKVLAK